MTRKHALLASLCGTFLAGSSFEAAATPPEYDAPQQTTAPASQAGPPSQAATLAKSWNDLHTQLGNSGYALALTYEGEVFGNWGGARQRVISDGLLGAALDVDLGRVTGFWKDATLHGNVLYIYGPRLSDQYIGAFSDTSNLDGYNSFRLQELWVQQNLLDKHVSLRAGLLAIDTEFFAAQASTLFINSTFGAFNLLAANITDPPIYPVANPGVRLDIAPIPAFDLKAALFGMTTESDPEVSNKHGVSLGVDTGPLFALEASWLVNQTPNDKGPVGSYRLGGFVQQGDYPTFYSQAQDALGTGRLSKNGTNYGIYCIANQEIYKRDARKVELFARGGYAPPGTSFVDWYCDAGCNCVGFIPGRDCDIAGIAVARSWVSRDFSDSQQLEGGPAYSAETVIELTYKYQAAAWWMLQPDLQFVLTPSGASGSRNATVLGLRTTLSF